MQFRYAALLYGTVVLTPFVAAAQQRTTGLSPTDSGIAVPAMKYESAFTRYVPFREEELAPWREVNDEAARVGGHLGTFGGAAGHVGHVTTKPAVQTSAPKPPAPPAAQMMRGGGHEGMKK